MGKGGNIFQYYCLTINMGVLGQVVVQARGVGGLRRDPGDPLDEIVKGSRSLEAVRKNPDSRRAELFGMGSLLLQRLKFKKVGLYYGQGAIIAKTIIKIN